MGLGLNTITKLILGTWLVLAPYIYLRILIAIAVKKRHHFLKQFASLSAWVYALCLLLLCGILYLKPQTDYSPFRFCLILWSILSYFLVPIGLIREWVKRTDLRRHP